MSDGTPGGCVPIEIRGETLLLHPDRAVIWHQSLIIADPHFGKDDTFRRAGIAVPHGPAVADLQRLTALLEATACERLVVLGDFVHAATREGDSFRQAFMAWRNAHAGISVDVIAGNHDRHESAKVWSSVARWHTKPLVEPPFVFAHHPGSSEEGYVLAGHIHPVFRIAERSHKMRVPVFWQRADHLVLPSFGGFTGGANIWPEAQDRLYAAGPERVVLLRRGVASGAD